VLSAPPRRPDSLRLSARPSCRASRTRWSCGGTPRARAPPTRRVVRGCSGARRSWWRCGRRGRPISRRPAPGLPLGGPPAVRGSGHSHHVLIVGNHRDTAPHDEQEQQGASNGENHGLKLLVAVVDRGHERMHVEAVYRVLVVRIVFPVAELGLVTLAFGQITQGHLLVLDVQHLADGPQVGVNRKSTRLNSSHVKTSYAVFCLKK